MDERSDRWPFDVYLGIQHIYIPILINLFNCEGPENLALMTFHRLAQGVLYMVFRFTCGVMLQCNNIHFICKYIYMCVCCVCVFKHEHRGKVGLKRSNQEVCICMYENTESMTNRCTSQE